MEDKRLYCSLIHIAKFCEHHALLERAPAHMLCARAHDFEREHLERHDSKVQGYELLTPTKTETKAYMDMRWFKRGWSMTTGAPDNEAFSIMRHEHSPRN